MRLNITLLWRSLLSSMLAFFLLFVSGFTSPDAQAVTQIKLTDLSADLCPDEVGEGTVTSGGPTLRLANCFLITGTTKNPSNSPVVDADVFGRIYDTNNNPVMENRTRLGSISEVDPGVGTFELRISVPEGLKPPLQLEQFKASGFAAKVR
ncbi:MAG: hypothetical protein AAF329_10580 [Cyanobacteria bacterium P01_A01_bin.17]